ncbi:RraA family protein [Aeromicrobium ponti]|uniref:Putative 4-hydroxy-4-methyl-2-oxoglutarate aldolase n=1 Tax=Cytobacillus oceanisediminis TaxID=665099 RepID=A0A562JRH5_9BACI|nr:RraA family protein [Cytobacillus oceanisediminis]TWH85782.1 regulator of RNase E activity RraA [Cytobacillus oceanisediminis]
MSNVGCRIYTNFTRPEKELVRAFENMAVANIADNMNRSSCLNSNIKPMNSGRILGPALTVKSRKGDNLLFHKALDIAQPGDIIVVDAQGDTSNAVAGEIMMRYAIKKGIGGFLIDGVIRDLDSITESLFPVYAIGTSPNGPYKDGPGEINVPISCGGVVVHPGDIVVGDKDGVVIINPKDAPFLLEKTNKTNKWEEEVFESIENNSFNREWIDKKLMELGCEIINN